MSPEQVRGQELDERTDLFSLGLVLYEMSTGERAFTGNTSGVIFDAILNRAPTPPVRLNPAIPIQLEQIIAKSLEKDRELRYRSASDIRADLQRLKRDTDSSRAMPYTSGQASRQELRRLWPHFVWSGVLAILLLLFGLNVGNVRDSLFGGASQARIESIAVLPFANLSNDPKTEYLSDGLTESLINSLSQLPNLAVMSRNTVFRYKGQASDPQKVGRDLHVRTILTGRLIQTGDDLTISVNLEDVTNNRQIWGEQYNRKLSNLVAVQQEIAGDIYGRLRPRLAGEERKLLAKRPTEDAEAYQLYLQGLFYWNKWTQADFKKAADFFTQAVQRDQHYALSYAGLADTYSLLGDAGYLPPSEAWPKAKAAAMQARDIDDSLEEVYAHMGKQKEAVAEREKALSLSGGAELAASIEEDFKKSGYKGVLQSWLEGLTELSKHSYVSSYSIAESYMRMGEKQKAFEWLEKAYEEHDSGLVSLAVEPMFESLRSDPRFKEIVRRMKLAH